MKRTVLAIACALVFTVPLLADVTIKSTGTGKILFMSPDMTTTTYVKGLKMRIDNGEPGGTIKSITHDYSHFNWIFSGSDLVVCEGTSHGEHKDGPWRAGVPEWAAGRWCDVFEIRDWKIHRCFIYLDPDYAGQDTARYPWIKK